jgi:protoporphyrinogen oxidase
MKQSDKRVIVLGGGIAGLTVAWKLSQEGIKVTVLERDPVVGGLSKTISYKKFLFDYSAHRFNSGNSDVIKRFKELVGNHLIRRKKITYIRHWGKFLQYPPRVIELVQTMPRLLLFQASFEFLGTFIKNLFYSPHKKSFADWTRGYFGKTLSYNLNEKYAEKIWKRPANQLSSDWASVRVGSFKLKDFLFAAFFPKYYKKIYSGSDPDTDFFYYCDVGIGYFPKQMAKAISRLRGVVTTNATTTKITQTPDGFLVTYNENGKEFTLNATSIVSTVPLPTLVKLIEKPIPSDIINAVSKLEYLNVLVVNILLNKKKVNNASWVYFPDRDIIFNYLVEFRNWSKKMTPLNKTSLSANVTCVEGDAIWNMKDTDLIQRVTNDMVKVGQIDKKDYFGGFVSRVPYAYPIYDLQYKERLERVKKYFQSIPRLYLTGRTGNFDYANSDVVMEKSLNLADTVIKDL